MPLEESQASSENAVQRFFKSILPKSWGEAMEAESRQWLIQCPCGNSKSVWDAGGIRWLAAGKKRTYLRCSKCGAFHWMKVEKQLKPAVPER